MKKLKCAMVGLGRIGWHFHIPQILQHPGFELTAAVDPDPARLAEAEKTFGAVKLYADILEVPCETIDLAVIASPTKFHCEQTVHFLKNGVDVFCDKPAAMNPAEAKTMEKTASATGRKLMVYQPHRLTAETQCARAILSSGKLGEIFMVRRTSVNFVRRDDWQARSEAGGGMLANYGSHFIDQFLYLLRDSTDRVKCEKIRAISIGDAEDVVQLLLVSRKGILFHLDINMACPFREPSLALFGTCGTAVCQPDGQWTLKYCPQEAMPHKTVADALAAPNRMYPSENLPWREEHPSFQTPDNEAWYEKCYDYFALGKSPFVPFSQTLELVRTIELCRKDSETIRNYPHSKEEPWKKETADWPGISL